MPGIETTHSAVRMPCLPQTIAKKQLFFLLQVGLSLLCALSYVQSVITTSQRRRVATIKILFAKGCKTYGIWGLKMASEVISKHLFLGVGGRRACPQIPLDTMCCIYKLWPYHLQIACCNPYTPPFLQWSIKVNISFHCTVWPLHSISVLSVVLTISFSGFVFWFRFPTC